MLVNHANPGPDRIRGRAPRSHCSIHQDLACIGRIHSVKDVHGGGLACAILANDRLNCSSLDTKVDALISGYSAETLADVPHFDGRKAAFRMTGTHCFL